MSTSPFKRLADEFRRDAETLHRWGADAEARAAATAADRIEAAATQWQLEGLTLDQASAESGFSESNLRRLVRDGRLENIGDGRRLKVRRGDLPRKASGDLRNLANGEPDLAARVLHARGLDVP